MAKKRLKPRSTKATIAIHVPPGTHVMRVERARALVLDDVMREASWIVWLHPSPGFEHGTFLRLYADGRAERVTLYEDGTEDVLQVKGQDT